MSTRSRHPPLTDCTCRESYVLSMQIVQPVFKISMQRKTQQPARNMSVVESRNIFVLCNRNNPFSLRDTSFRRLQGHLFCCYCISCTNSYKDISKLKRHLNSKRYFSKRNRNLKIKQVFLNEVHKRYFCKLKIYLSE